MKYILVKKSLILVLQYKTVGLKRFFSDKHTLKTKYESYIIKSQLA